MLENGNYVFLKDNRIVRIESVYDGIPELYIVCYVNCGGYVGYAKKSDLLAGISMTKKEYKAFRKKG